ncbi:MAG: hypothetical protein ABFD50_10505 [Smithella sp.]
MSNISIKINLRRLKSHVMKLNGKNGPVECIVLPIEPNNLVVGEKGIYLDLQAYGIKERKTDSKQTHLVKQSLPEDVYRLLSDEDKKNLPIIGGAIQWDLLGEQPNDYHVEQPEAEEDLPF